MEIILTDNALVTLRERLARQGCGARVRITATCTGCCKVRTELRLSIETSVVDRDADCLFELHGMPFVMDRLRMKDCGKRHYRLGTAALRG